jgi:hypothetical protein
MNRRPEHPQLIHPGEHKTMTHNEIMKCQPGTSLDLLVAEACGIEYARNSNPSGLHDWQDEGVGVSKCLKCWDLYQQGYLDPPPPANGCKPSPIMFQPSIDWNDAMTAAERMDLFATGPDEDDSFGFIDRVTDGGPYKWRVCRHRHTAHSDLRVTVIATAETGPLAICRAILLNARHKDEGNT